MFIIDCNETVQMCYNMRKLLVIAKTVIQVVQWSVPLLLVFMGTWDMFKAVTKANDQKVTQDAIKSFIRRLIAGVIVFLIPFLVRLVLGLFTKEVPVDGNISSSSWVDCWTHVGEKDTESKRFFQGCSNIYEKRTEEKSRNDESSNSDTSNDSLTCYGYTVFTCDKGVLASPDEHSVGYTCRLSTKLGNSYSTCSNLCYNEYKTHDNYYLQGVDKCYCLFTPKKSLELFQSTVPKVSGDGSYKIYQCTGISNCKDAGSFCTSTGQGSTTKQSSISSAN